jgi:hypothetical protein
MSDEEESMAFDELAEHAIYREQDLVRDFGEFAQDVPPLVDDWLRSAWRGSLRAPALTDNGRRGNQEISR